MGTIKNFLNIALGSLAELETQTVIAKELRYRKTEINEKHIIDLTQYALRCTQRR